MIIYILSFFVVFPLAFLLSLPLNIILALFTSFLPGKSKAKELLPGIVLGLLICIFSSILFKLVNEKFIVTPLIINGVLYSLLMILGDNTRSNHLLGLVGMWMGLFLGIVNITLTNS